MVQQQSLSQPLVQVSQSSPQVVDAYWPCGGPVTPLIGTVERTKKAKSSDSCMRTLLIRCLCNRVCNYVVT